MSSELLYNKYRADRYDTIFGQEHITAPLKGLVKSNSYEYINSMIFAGKAGGGKTTLSRIFAKSINCEDPVDGEACNQCDHCLQFKEGTYPDYIEIDGASYNKVEDAKRLAELATMFPLVDGGNRIILIDEAHRLSSAAWDSLLKLLEEGETKTLFLFATTELYNIRPAIQSRSFIFNVMPINARELNKLLVGICEDEGIEYSREVIQRLSFEYVGRARDAIKMIDFLYRSFGNCLEMNTKSPDDIVYEIFTKAFNGELDEARDMSDDLYSVNNLSDTVIGAIAKMLSNKHLSREQHCLSAERLVKTMGKHLREIAADLLVYRPSTVEQFKLYLAFVAEKGLGSKSTVTKRNLIMDSNEKSDVKKPAKPLDLTKMGFTKKN